jgi:hypothetical protein
VTVGLAISVAWPELHFSRDIITGTACAAQNISSYSPLQ